MIALVPGFQSLGAAIAFAAGVKAHLLTSYKPLIEAQGYPSNFNGDSGAYVPTMAAGMAADLQGASAGTINPDGSVTYTLNGASVTVVLPRASSVSTGPQVTPIRCARQVPVLTTLSADYESQLQPVIAAN